MTHRFTFRREWFRLIIFIIILFLFRPAHAQAPVLGVYPNSTIVAGASTTVTPSVPPANIIRTVVTTHTDFEGVLSVHPVTGVVTVTNALHAGTYTVKVKGFDALLNSATATFSLTVSNPACSPGLFNAGANIAVSGGSQQCAVGDFNNDGLQDLVNANNGTTLSIRLGNGAGGFVAMPDITAGNTSRYVAVADFNGDGNQDVVCTNVSSANFTVALGDGTGAFPTVTNFTTAAFPTSVTTGDFNNDGITDLVIATSGGTISVFLGIGDGTFNASSTFSMGNAVWYIAVGDFNEDGNEDLAIPFSMTTSVYIRLGNGTGTFTAGANVTVGTGTEWITIADFNNDNHQDFAVNNTTANTVSVRYGDGTGAFIATPDFGVGNLPVSVSAGDINGDGNTDIVVQRNAGTEIYAGNGTGTFSAVTTFGVGGSARRATVADFNNDNIHDVAVPNSASAIHIRLGHKPEMVIRGNTLDINDGDNTPSLTDFTNLGTSCSGPIVKTFMVHNTGGVMLSLSSMSISGTHASDFAVTAAPSAAIAPGGSTYFQITFTPGGAGPRNATITVNNTDCDEASYDFAITGMLTTPITITSAVTHATCFGESNAAIDITAAGGTPGYTYLWGDGPSVNVYSAWDPATIGGSLSLSAGNLRAVTSSGANHFVYGTSAVTTGKWYWENTLNGSSLQGARIGVRNMSNGNSYSFDTYSGLRYANNSASSYSSAAAPGDVIGVALDFTTGYLTFYKNGVSLGIAYAALPAGTYKAFLMDGSSSSGIDIDVTTNFGSSPFVYPVPAGYTAGLYQTVISGLTVEDRTGITAATYSVIVTDANGCTGSAAISVTQPAAITGTTTITHVACFGGATGAINLTPTGGTGPYTFLWSSGPTTEDRTLLTAGTYSVQVTDATGCTGTVTATVTQPAAPVSGTTSVTHASCFGSSNGAIDLTPTGGTNPYTYLWSTGHISQDRSGATAGIYTVQITDALGCSATLTATITQPPSLPAGTTSVTNVSCFGGNNGSIDLTPSGGTPGYTYYWSGGITTQDLTGLTAGNYNVTISDANGCSRNLTVSVTAPPALSANIASAPTGCASNTGTATVSSVSGGTPSYSYSWAPSGGTAATASSLAAGTYTCTITDANSCSLQLVVTVGTTTSPALNLSAFSNVSCFGGNDGMIGVALPSGGTAPYVYDWTPGAPVGDGTRQISTLTAGTYVCTVTDANGCTGTFSYTITQPAAPVSGTTVVTNLTCFGGTNGAINLTPAGGTSPYTFLWSTGHTTEDRAGLSAGTYSVTITDFRGCATVVSATVTAPPAVAGTTTVTNVACFGGSNGTINLTPSGGTGPYTFVWSTGQTTEDHSGLTAGTYSVIISDVNGCTGAASATITEPSQISLTAAAQTNVSCSGGSNGTFDVNAATGGTGAFTYDWSPGNPTGDGTTSVTGLTAGTYTVTATDANGCAASISFTITEPSPISFTAAAQTNVSCSGGSNGTFDVNAATGGTGAFTYDWSPGNPTGDGTTSVTGLTAGSYTVTATDANGCAASISFTITEPSPISFTAAAQTNVSCSGGSNGAFDVNAAIGGTGAFTYDWEPGNPTGDGTTSVTGLTAGTWTVTATDVNGCSSTISFTITEPPVLIAASSATAIACNGGTATVTVTGSGGTSPYTGEGTFTEVAGTHSYIVTDANGCTSTTSVTISEPDAITFTSTQTDVACSGGTDGTAMVVATGGTGSYTFAWSSGGSSTTETGLAAGNYSVVITDSNLCSATASFTITEPNALSVSVINTVNPSACVGTDGSIDIDVNGGISSYTFLWSNGDINEDLTAIAAGAYSVTVTDANGCTATASASINDPDAPIVTVSLPMDTACGSFPGVINLSGESPAGGTWSGNTVSGNTFDPFAAGSGTHFISYTFTDANGCSASATDSLYVDLCMGVETASATGWSLYPNPTDGFITLGTSNTLTSDVIVEIYAADGKLISSENKQQASTIAIDITSEPVGVYFVKVISNGTVTTHRLVKM
jgi:hypothetical protein